MLTKEHFEDLYVHQRLTIRGISKRTGVPNTTLSRWRKKWGIETIDRHISWVGKRSGLLVVVREVRGSKGVPIQCVCLCKCGKEHTVIRGNLQATASCGCGRRPDLAGQRFGKLVVLKEESKRSPKGTRLLEYRCKCDCGNETVVASGDLRLKSTKSCGCLRAPTIPQGTKYNLLTVGEKVQTPKGWVYRCTCDCGGSKEVSSTDLKRGSVQSCGCRLGPPLPPGEAARNEVYGGYKKNAAAHNRIFDITLEQAEALFRQNCTYCGVAPSRVKRGRKGDYTYNGIDRVDSSKGYTSANVVSCCWPCNKGKQAMSPSEFLSWASRIGTGLFAAKDLVGEAPQTFPWRTTLKSYKRGAQNRGLPFALSDVQAAYLFGNPCWYCGREPSNGGVSKERYSGIDRVDNSKGYTPKNCVSCCKTCNRAKGTDTVAAFLSWAARVRAYRSISTT